MAVLRLELDIDSDVYPVLHARLQSIRSPLGREECMRQLAASGLLWETLQVPAKPVAVRPSPEPAPAARAHAAHDVPPAPPAAPHRPPAPAAAHRSAARPAPHRPVAPAPPADPHFIDLAIDTVAPPASYEHLAAWELDDLVQTMGRRLPVLDEVVDPTPMPSGDAEPDRRADAGTPALATSAWLGAEPSPTASPAAHDAPIGTAVPAGDEAEAEAEATWGGDAKRPAARSRLLKMKDRGLFNNR